MDKQSIEVLANKLGTTANEFIGYYADWYFAQAIGFIVLGLLVIWVAKRVDIAEFTETVQVDGLGYVVKYFLYFIGALFLVANIPDLFSPEGIGAHKLIKDIRG